MVVISVAYNIDPIFVSYHHFLRILIKKRRDKLYATLFFKLLPTPIQICLLLLVSFVTRSLI